jgi:DNA-binding transcriptional MerR regulator
VRIAELSRLSGVTTPTIKYYLREGLLPPGEPTGRNQAAYGEAHLRRLRLIRGLRDVGGLSVAAVREVLASLDEPSVAGHDLMGRAHRAVIRPSTHDRTDPAWLAARDAAETWMAELGWSVAPDAPALDLLADVFATLRQLDQDTLLECLTHYAEAALIVAGPEVASAAAHPEPADMIAAVVVGTVLGERLLAAVRLLAHEHVSATLTDAVPEAGRA